MKIKIKFISPHKVLISYRDGKWNVDDTLFKISLSSDSPEHLWRDYLEALAFLVDNFCVNCGNNLSLSEKKLKRDLERFVLYERSSKL